MRYLPLSLLLALAFHPALAQLTSFPGAEGHGAATRGGAGGPVTPKIIVVNTLADGIDPDPMVTTLREAVLDPDPRIVVFEVAGYLDLQCQLSIFDPFITIAGQTAPAPGITLRYERLNILTHDVILQHMRFRIGDKPFGNGGSYEFHGIFAGARPNYNCPSSWDPSPRPFDEPCEPDEPIEECDPSTPKIVIHDVMIDHVSINWAIGVSVVLGHSELTDFTLSNSIVGEPLSRNSHWKGAHGKGFLPHVPGMTRLSIVKNLFAHSADRNPLTTGGVDTYVANNVVYASWPPSVTGAAGAPSTTSLQGNVIRTRVTIDPFWTSIGLGGAPLDHALIVSPSIDPATTICFADNQCPVSGDCNEYLEGAVGPEPESFNLVTTDPCPVHEPDSISVLPSTDVLDHVLADAGAFPHPDPGERPDVIDARVVTDTMTRGGTMIDCVDGTRIDHLSGTIESSTPTTITLTDGGGVFSSIPGYIGYRVEIFWFDGMGFLFEDRKIVAYDGGGRTATLGSPLPVALPETGEATFQIYQPCTLNAGGWPPVAAQTRSLGFPADPLEPGQSGYLVLEEWIHGFGETPEVTYVTAYPYNTGFQVTWRTERSDGADLWATSRLEYRPEGESSWRTAPASSLPSHDHRATILGQPENTTFEFRAIHDVFGVEHVAPIGTVNTGERGTGGQPLLRPVRDERAPREFERAD